MTFGISSAPEVWQRKMHETNEGLDGSEVIADDFLITGKDDAEHDANLRVPQQMFTVFGLAWLPGIRVAWLICFRVLCLTCFCFAWLPGFRVACLNGFRVACLIGFRVARLPGFRVECLHGLRVACLTGFA